MMWQDKDTFGRWRVTTEGDCEGRSVKDLGAHVGHLDEIAYKLRGNCYYSLRFEPDDEPLSGTACSFCGGTGRAPEAAKPSGQLSVHVSFPASVLSGLVPSEERARTVGEWLAGRPVTVRPGRYFGSVFLDWS